MKYIYRDFFTVGYYSILSRVPSATQYVFVFFKFCLQLCVHELLFKVWNPKTGGQF